MRDMRESGRGTSMETEAASSAVQAVGFIHPVMADVMTILSFVLVVAAVAIAAVTTSVLVIPIGLLATLALVLGIVFALLFCRWMTAILGGVTGDVYGAATVLTETIVLAVFSLASSYSNVWGLLWR